MTQSARNRIQFRAAATAGQGETIALDEVLPFNTTLLQLLVVYGGVPAAGDTVSFGKESSIDPRLNIDPIREFLVGANAWQEVICNEHFEYFIGDHLLVTAGNGNDLDIGVEVILGEAG